MNEKQIALIESSFLKVAPVAEEAAAVFYNRLFELDPSLRELFRGDMKEQGRKLMATLALVVNSLHRLDVIIPAVRNLGAKHVRYGVRDEHYETVGNALIWTLAQGLAEDFTEETRVAWIAAYTLLADTMKAAAAEAAA